MHTDIIASDDYSLYSSYNDKTKVGYDDAKPKLIVLTEGLFKQYMNQCENVLENIKKFDYAKLSKSQQQNYDIVCNYLDRELLYKDFYIYYVTFNYPSYLNQYYIMLTKKVPTSKNDLDMLMDIYINSLNDIDSICQLLKKQLDSKVITKDCITSCKQLCNTTYIKDLFSSAVDSYDFLTKREKNEYKEKFAEKIRKANMDKKFKKSIQIIDKIESKFEKLSAYKNHVSIFPSTKKGKAYFEACTKREFGLSMDVKSLEKYLLSKADEIKNKLNRYESEKGIAPIYKTFGEKISYTTQKSYYDMYNEFCDLYVKYFPKCDYLKCKVYYSELPKGIGGIYRNLTIDQTYNSCYLFFSNDYHQEYYTVVAHESVPGHLYQESYNNYSNIPEIRKYKKYLSYIEGWASYVENYVTNNYEIIDKDKAIVYNLCGELKYIYRSLGEIYVNYYGWDRDKFIKFYKENIPEEDTSYVTNNEIYDNILNSRFYYSVYSIYNFRFQELYNSAKGKLGDKFNDIEFHKIILDCGQTDIDIIDKYVNEYINDNLKTN